MDHTVDMLPATPGGNCRFVAVRTDPSVAPSAWFHFGFSGVCPLRSKSCLGLGDRGVTSNLGKLSFLRKCSWAHQGAMAGSVHRRVPTLV